MNKYNWGNYGKCKCGGNIMGRFKGSGSGLSAEEYIKWMNKPDMKCNKCGKMYETVCTIVEVTE